MRAPAKIYDPLLRAVVTEFGSRFVPQGCVIWIKGSNPKPVYLSKSGLKQVGLYHAPQTGFPNVIICHRRLGYMVLVSVANMFGVLTKKRRAILDQAFHSCKLRLQLVTAFESRAEFQELATEVPWGTWAWFAEETNHLVQFDGRRLLGPQGNWPRI